MILKLGMKHQAMELDKDYMGGFKKNEVFFNIKAELISFIHIRSQLYLKCVL